MQPFLPHMLPIQGMDYASLVPALGKAHRALGRYDNLLKQSRSHWLMPLLARREALLSARIEGSQSTLSGVLQFEADAGFAQSGEQRDDLSEILNYVSALHHGARGLADPERRLTLNLLRGLHGILLGDGVRGQSKHPGAFRLIQNWVGVPEQPMEQARFVPPPPVRVLDYMENWARFYRSDQPDALVQAAVMHAQFTIIHPFEDDNDRISRLLIPLFLYEKELIARPAFYPSAYLERHWDAYMAALRPLNDRNGDWNAWTLFFLQATATQADEAAGMAESVMRLHEELSPRVVDSTHSQFAALLLDAMFERPVFKQATIAGRLAEQLAAPPTGATLYNLLRRLVSDGTLEVVEPGRGRRGTLYTLPALVRLLTDAK